MRRRDFLVLIWGTAVGWSRAVRAQQRPILPVVGYLSSRSAADSAHIVAAFRQGLTEAGFVEHQNVLIEWRCAEGQFDRLPSLAAELVQRPVGVLVTTGGTV